MDFKSLNVNDIVFNLQEEVNDVLRILREKGAKHYQNQLMLAGGCLFGVYFLLYSPTNRKIENLRSRIWGEQAKFQFVEEFEGLRMMLLSAYTQMPKPQHKDNWLVDKVLQSATANGVIIDTMGTQEEAQVGEVLMLTLNVSTKLDYARLGKWIEALENEKPVLFVTGMSVQKSQDQATLSQDGLGVNKVDLKIGTAMPRKIAVN